MFCKKFYFLGRDYNNIIDNHGVGKAKAPPKTVKNKLHVDTHTKERVFPPIMITVN